MGVVLAQLKITNPPDYVDVKVYKKKKSKLGGYVEEVVRKYFTANIWYALGQGVKSDAKIRAAAKAKANKFFLVYLNRHCPVLKPEDYPIRVKYEIHRKLSYFDLDNKAFFWSKLFHDYLVKNKRIAEDSVEFIQEINYKYVESIESKLIITIESINKTEQKDESKTLSTRTL